nr:serine/threonine-protein kinase RIO2-like [Quercus suber]
MVQLQRMYARLDILSSELYQVKQLPNLEMVFERIIGLVVPLAEKGLIHCDFNQFNIMIDDDEKVNMIDFPHMVSVNHHNAEMYFDHDVKCIFEFFRKRSGTKKVKDTKLQMLTTRFEELKMGNDEALDSFYGKLNEIVIAKHNLSEKIEDAKVVKKILGGKPFSKGKFSSSKGVMKEFKKKDREEFQSPQGIVCYECNDHGHLKKECPNYLRGKGKMFAITLNDSDSSNSDIEGKCDSKGNYRAFMTIAFVDSKEDLSNLVDEIGNISEDEEIEESTDEEVCQNEGEKNL